MYLFFLLIQLVFAHPPDLQQEFYQRQRGKTGTVLVVITPGWEKTHYEKLLETLWQNGFSIWSVTFDLPNQNIEQMQIILQQALATLPEKTSIWAHGLAGTVVAQAVEQNKISPAAMVFTGTPLIARCSQALRSHLGMGGDIQGAEKLLYGSFQPKVVATLWTKNWQNWCDQQLQINLTSMHIPMWFANSGMDHVAPPENTRSMIGESPFVRISPLSFDLSEPNHYGLLQHHRTIWTGTRWLRQTMRRFQ